MTKNSDTSPWMHFPGNPGAIKRHNELVLSSIPTADLVAELATRDVEWLKLPQHEKIIFDMLFDRIQCKILVVRE